MLTKFPQAIDVNSKAKGFTLVELITGIVVLAVALSLIVPVLLPTQRQSAEQIMQIRAAELGQSMLNEILAKSFDEASDRQGGLLRCGEAGIVCTNAGAEEASRDLYDDVDDYHNLTFLANANNQSLSQYQGFAVNVQVSYQGNELGFIDNTLAKRITISVTTPLDSVISFTSYKTNF